jgi:hypothetical protein
MEDEPVMKFFTDRERSQKFIRSTFIKDFSIQKKNVTIPLKGTTEESRRSLER